MKIYLIRIKEDSPGCTQSFFDDFDCPGYSKIYFEKADADWEANYINLNRKNKYQKAVVVEFVSTPESEEKT